MIHSKFINSSPWSNPLVGSLAVLWDLYGSDATETEPIPKWNQNTSPCNDLWAWCWSGVLGDVWGKKQHVASQSLDESGNIAKKHVGNSKDSRKPDEPGIFGREILYINETDLIFTKAFCFGA